MDDINDMNPTFMADVLQALKNHENRSQSRYENLMEKVDHYGAGYKTEGTTMGEGINTDKVIVNAGSGGEGGGGAMAAVIAALGNRNQGNDNAALIAALGNRNDDSNSLAPLMAMMGGGGGWGNRGMEGILPFLLLALLGRGGRGGPFGGGDDCGGGGAGVAALLQTLMEGQSALRAEVPTVGLETQNALQNSIAQFALGTQQGFANVKDSIQNGIAFLDRDIQGVNQNVSAQGCQTRETVQNDGDKTRALLVSRFQQEDATRIAEQNARIVALETRCDNDRRHHESNLVITNTNTAVAQQQQQQQQRLDDDRHHNLLSAIIAFGNTAQRNRSDQDIINLGTMLASGTQTPTTTQVGRQ